MSKIECGKLVTESQGGKSISQTFVFDLPEREETEETAPEQRFGQIFGLIEIEAAPNKKTVAFLDALTQEIKAAATSSFGKPEERTPEELFENFIQKTNYRYLELIGGKASSAFSDDTTGGLPKINATLAFLNEKNIYLVGRGRILPFLIYQTKPGNFRIMNIAEGAAGKDGRTSKLSLFTNIVSGKIGGNDYLFFTTESILDYFSLEKICKTVSAATPEEAAETLKNLLGKTANPQTSFAFMIVKIKKEMPVIKAAPASSPPAQVDRISVPQHSMDGLLKTASDTEKMLTPSLGLNIGGGLFSFLGRFKRLFRKNEIKNNARLEYYSSQFHPPAHAGKFLRSFSLLFLAVLRIPYFIIKVTFSFLFNLLKVVFYLITNWKGRRKTVLEDTAAGLGKIWRTSWSKMGKLPRLSRALLVFVIIFIILFAGSTALLYRRYQNNIANKELQKIVETIQDKKISIDASLIYNDEEGARKFLAEADALLAQFPQKTKNEKEAYKKISGEIGTLREKLMHVVNILDPAVVANFPDYNLDAKVDKFIVASNNLYALDHHASVIYKINLNNNETVNKSVSGLNFELFFWENNNSAFLYQPEKKFFNLDLKNDILKELDVVLNENEAQVDDISVYNQKLYILDAKDNQIFKHPGTSIGFAHGTPWLKEGIDIRNAKSMAIDGSIYVGTFDGKILKFENGQQMDFSAEIIPSLSSEIKIWTSADTSFIYVLESSTKRLIVLNKQGKLQTQYFSEKFDNLKDFAVAEKEKRIYFLSDNSIYGITATHLQ